MLEFIRIQFELGRLSAAQVRGFAPRWLTAAQAEEILSARPEEEE